MPFLPSLNSLRFFGALSVIFLHMGSRDWFQAAGLEEYHVLISGNNGVVLFYVLSGFLLTTLALSEIETQGKFKFVKFMGRRVRRLFPLYYLAISVLFGLNVLGIVKISWNSFVYALSYSYNFVPKAEYSQHLGPFHTLATEEHFYLLFAVIFLLSNLVPNKWKPFGLFLVFASTLLSLDLLLPLASGSYDSHFVSRWTFIAAKPLFIGVLGAIVANSTSLGVLPRRLIGRNYDSVKNLTLLLTFVGLYGSQVFSSNQTLTSISFLALIIYLRETRDSRLSRVLSAPLLVYFGTISYGLYVWAAVLVGTSPGSWLMSNPLLLLLAVFLCSIVSFELLEKRFTSRRRNKADL